MRRTTGGARGTPTIPKPVSAILVIMVGPTAPRIRPGAGADPFHVKVTKRVTKG